MVELHTALHNRDADGRDRTIESYVEKGMDWMVEQLINNSGLTENERPYLFRGVSILDCGCDYGYAMDYLCNVHFAVKGQCTGIDLYYTINPFDLDIRREDSANLMLPDLLNRKFDIAILNHSLEHVLNPYLVMANLNKLLMNDGFIFLGLPHADSPWAQVSGHYTIWTVPWTDHFMKLNGWTPVCPTETRELRPDHVEIWALYERTEKGFSR